MNKDFFINSVLIPRMYDMAETLYEGFDFAEKGASMQAHARHIDGAYQEGGGKAVNVIIYQRTPFLAVEMGGHTLKGQKWCEVIEWYAYLNGMDRATAVKTLAEKCGCLDKYNETFANEKAEVDQVELQRWTNLGVAQNYFIEALHGTAIGAQVMTYMLKRGWTETEIAEASIGAFDRNMSGDVVPELLTQWNGTIGTTHVLACPLHINGRLDCFQFRHIKGKDSDLPKYMGETGHGKPLLYGDIGPRCLVVEGALDYLHARVNGIRNVLCTGGGAGSEQAKNLAKADRVKDVILWFDSDNAGRSFTHIMATPLLKAGKNVFVVKGQAGCKDIDEFLTAETKRGCTNEQKQKSVAHIMENAQTFDEWRPGALECTFVETILNAGVDKQNHIHISEVDPAHFIEARAKLEQMEDAVAILHHFEKGVKDMFSTMAPSKRDMAVHQLAKWNTEIMADGRKLPPYCDIKALRVEGEQLPPQSEENATTGTPDASNEKQGEGVDFTPFIHEYENAVESMDRINAGKVKGVPSMFAFPRMQAGKIQYITWRPGLTLLCANTGHGKTSILNAVALYDAKRNELLKNDHVTLYFSYEIPENELIFDLFNLYNGDAHLSRNSERTLESYFSQRMYMMKDEAERNKYFDRGWFDPSQSEQSVAQRPDVSGVTPSECNETHAKHLEKSVHEFFGRMMAKGGTLRLIFERYTVEQLMAGLEWYMAQVERGEQKRPSIVCIDYAQLIYSTKMEKAPRHEEIKWAMEQLNNVAKKYQIPIILPAQFNQTVAHPGKLLLTAIGEAGAFSRFADTVISFFNLNSLPKVINKDERAVVNEMLKDVGLDLSNDSTQPLPQLEGYIFARLLKRRKGAVNLNALFRWTGELKKIWPNVNEYVADKAVAVERGLTLESARDILKKTAENMKWRAVNLYNIQTVVANDTIMKTLSYIYTKREDEDEKGSEGNKENATPDIFEAGGGTSETSTPETLDDMPFPPADENDILPF